MTWVRPLLEALGQHGQPWDLSVVLWPRLFLSGLEAATARRLPGVSRVFDPVQALGLLAGAPLLRGRHATPPTVVLHLGGPAGLSLRLGRRLGAPVLAYGERPEALPPGFAAAYCTDPPGSPSRAGSLALGNLLVDSVRDLRAQRRDGPGADLAVGLLPGSRSLQLRHYLPRIGPVAEAVTRRWAEVRFLIARSPLTTDTMLQRAMGPGDDSRLESVATGTVLRTGGGLSIPVLERDEAMSRARVLVCTPGTNTGEAAALAIPHLVVAPFDPSLQLFTGIPGLVERSPWPGQALKRLAFRRLTGDMRYYAHANSRAGREIVPELQGPLNVGRVARQLTELLLDAPRRERISRELDGIMGPPGAARRLAAELERHLRPGRRQD